MPLGLANFFVLALAVGLPLYQWHRLKPGISRDRYKEMLSLVTFVGVISCVIGMNGMPAMSEASHLAMYYMQSDVMDADGILRRRGAPLLLWQLGILAELAAVMLALWKPIRRHIEQGLQIPPEKLFLQIYNTLLIELWIILGSAWLLSKLIGSTGLGHWLQPTLFVGTLSFMTFELTLLWGIGMAVKKFKEKTT